jgi:uncharacterized protein
MLSSTPSFLIVDGHSVIHAWDELRKLHRDSPRRHLARLTLLKRMRTYQDMTGVRVVVVFDGIGERITDEREQQGLQIFYADSSHTADAVIERLAAKYAKEYPLRVATADGMERDTVEAFGAICISPQELLYEVERAEQQLQQRIKR